MGWVFCANHLRWVGKGFPSPFCSWGPGDAKPGFLNLNLETIPNCVWAPGVTPTLCHWSYFHLSDMPFSPPSIPTVADDVRGPQHLTTSMHTNLTTKGQNLHSFFFFFLLCQVLITALKIFDLHCGMTNLLVWHVGSGSQTRD